MNEWNPSSDGPAASPPLTAGGERRRGEILAKACRQARSSRRRRAVQRGALVTCGLILGGLVALSRLRSHEPPPLVHVSPTPATAPISQMKYVAPTHAALPPRQIDVTRLSTDATLVDTLAMPPQPRSWERISDEQLLKGLADAGKPAALSYTAGRVRLVYSESKTR